MSHKHPHPGEWRTDGPPRRFLNENRPGPIDQLRRAAPKTGFHVEELVPPETLAKLRALPTRR